MTEKKIKIFGVIQKVLIITGLLEANHINGKQYRYIAQIITHMVECYGVATTTWYFLFDANTFEEHAIAIPLTDALIYTSLKYCIILWHRIALINYVGKINRTIETRKKVFQCVTIFFF